MKEFERHQVTPPRKPQTVRRYCEDGLRNAKASEQLGPAEPRGKTAETTEVLRHNVGPYATRATS